MVVGITPNEKLIADAGGPYTGNVGEEITLDGGSSYDPDGSIVLYEWDLDNDWNFDIRTNEPTD